jgi:hypothetical protein
MSGRMGWGALASQFCLELGFGVLLALAFVRKAPVGRFFHRMMASAALLPVAAAVAAPLYAGTWELSEPAVWCAALALLGWPFVSAGPGRRWAPALLWSLAWTAAALAAAVRAASAVHGPLEVALGSLSAMATGCVAGSVSLAMVLGHWYLTVPRLDVRHLERLNRVTALSMVLSLALLGVSCLVFADALDAAETPLLGPWGLFHLGTRVATGLLLPLCFAWMTAGSLKFRNTRSATGILYASTILVLIGTAASVSLQDSYGIPL